jgi:peptidoglycan/LPS O-acetylase OafA/YrhL
VSCMDGIAFGCITALFSAKYKLNAKILKWVTWLGFILFIVSILFKRQLFKLGLTDLGLNVTLMEISTALVIVSIHGRMGNSEVSNDRLTTLIRWFGRNSYEVYLTHMFVVTAFVGTSFMDQHGSSTLFIGFILILGISGMIGYAVARFFSEPANRWIRAKFTRNMIGMANIRK